MSVGPLFTLYCVPVHSHRSCPTLWDPMDRSLPGVSVRGILSAKILVWVTIPSFRRSSLPRDQGHISCITEYSLPLSFWGSSYPLLHAKSLQLCVTLSNPMDCSPPGSSVHGILQTRILEWVPCPYPLLVATYYQDYDGEH